MLTKESQPFRSPPHGQGAIVGRSAFSRTARTYCLIVAITAIVSLALGEAYLRLAYWQGTTFGAGGGPLGDRFERDVVFNRYDGPSRGPEIAAPKAAGGVHILIQGDSITWGKGVGDERALYSSLLLERLRQLNPRVEMAVLARAGREIDGHLEQIGKWGQEIHPDIIIYQWFVNDLELDKSRRPDTGRAWRRFIFPSFIKQHSYLWYLLDYRIGTWMQAKPYEDYIREQFPQDSEGWRLFATLFHAWAVEAKRLTPNLLVSLHPYLVRSPEVPLRELSARVAGLCAKEGIAVIDLLEALEVYRDDFTQTFASPFDSHPNAAAHARIADALYHRLLELWPTVFVPRPPALARPGEV
jgi:lysophospholipase L1-like esterase